VSFSVFVSEASIVAIFERAWVIMVLKLFVRGVESNLGEFHLGKYSPK